MQHIRDRYPNLLVLRSEADMDRYDDATEAFARGGSQRELMTRPDGARDDGPGDSLARRLSWTAQGGSGHCRRVIARWQIWPPST
jgi:hypothetical protein